MIVVVEDKSCEPTVFSFPFPENIKELYHKEVIMNSYLYCAGLLLLWLITEELCPELMAAYVALWSENSPTVVWVKRFAARGSKIAMQLLRSLTLRVKHKGGSPLTPLHIQGDQNEMTDIPSHSFGRNPAWICKTNYDLRKFFNEMFPLPNQTFWTVLSPYSAVSMKVILIVWMDHFEMGEWLQLKKSGKRVVKIGSPTVGSGTLVTGCLVPAKSSVPHRICSLCTLKPVRSRQISCSWHSLWGLLACWNYDSFVL